MPYMGSLPPHAPAQVIRQFPTLTIPSFTPLSPRCPREQLHNIDPHL